MGIRRKGRLPEKRLIFFQAVVSSGLKVMELQNFFREDCLTARIICRAFARQHLRMMMSVMDRVRLMQRKACFLFLIAACQSFRHHGTERFRQGFVFGMEKEAASKRLISKSWDYRKFTEKDVNVEAHISLKWGQFSCEIPARTNECCLWRKISKF